MEKREKSSTLQGLFKMTSTIFKIVQTLTIEPCVKAIFLLNSVSPGISKQQSFFMAS